MRLAGSIAGAGAGQFFLNGADTETSGIDFVATYNTEGFGGTLDFTLAANFTETEVVSLFTPSGSGLETVPVESVFSDQEISIIEEWQPEDRIRLVATPVNLYRANARFANTPLLEAKKRLFPLAMT